MNPALLEADDLLEKWVLSERLLFAKILKKQIFVSHDAFELIGYRIYFKESNVIRQDYEMRILNLKYELDRDPVDYSTQEELFNLERELQEEESLEDYYLRSIYPY